ncbi:hypothetical protein FB45DRAFT_1017954 [Roridomyces roridus]|uniref:Uncharacterized protein n=1 Tax=Roridomyces roridus TaxID=1738132 RepID=A0AAD7CK09_9AGAR|nr:hypothetical protein FB45DRAFT_1017954 [Roridomyces roridus]
MASHACVSGSEVSQPRLPLPLTPSIPWPCAPSSAVHTLALTLRVPNAIASHSPSVLDVARHNLSVHPTWRRSEDVQSRNLRHADDGADRRWIHSQAIPNTAPCVGETPAGDKCGGVVEMRRCGRGAVVTLTVGAQQFAKHKAIVTCITAIEEFAGVTILCSDKTGTLTINKLTIDRETIITYSSFSAEDVILLAAYALRTENQDTIDASVVQAISNVAA